MELGIAGRDGHYVTVVQFHLWTLPVHSGLEVLGQTIMRWNLGLNCPLIFMEN